MPNVHCICGWSLLYVVKKCTNVDQTDGQEVIWCDHHQFALNYCTIQKIRFYAPLTITESFDRK